MTVSLLLSLSSPCQAFNMMQRIKAKQQQKNKGQAVPVGWSSSRRYRRSPPVFARPPASAEKDEKEQDEERLPPFGRIFTPDPVKVVV